MAVIATLTGLLIAICHVCSPKRASPANATRLVFEVPATLLMRLTTLFSAVRKRAGHGAGFNGQLLV